jgi:hypothetical protein
MIDSIIEEKTHPLGGFYLARAYDGRLVAGRDRRTAARFQTAEAVYEAFLPFVEEGAHWAWNICYAVEDLREAEPTLPQPAFWRPPGAFQA